MRLAPATRVRLRRFARGGSQALMSALLLWILSALLNQGGQNARMSEQLTSVQVQVAGLYRSSDAQRDRADIARDIAILAARVDQHDRRIDAVEQATVGPVVSTAARSR